MTVDLLGALIDHGRLRAASPCRLVVDALDVREHLGRHGAEHLAGFPCVAGLKVLVHLEDLQRAGDEEGVRTHGGWITAAAALQFTCEEGNWDGRLLPYRETSATGYPPSLMRTVGTSCSGCGSPQESPGPLRALVRPGRCLGGASWPLSLFPSPSPFLSHGGRARHNARSDACGTQTPLTPVYWQ